MCFESRGGILPSVRLSNSIREPGRGENEVKLGSGKASEKS